jgi:hypothetical protein
VAPVTSGTIGRPRPPVDLQEIVGRGRAALQQAGRTREPPLAPALGTLLLLVVFLGAWGGVDRPARADHTGVMQLNDRAGPYVVRAFSEPDPPRTDRCRITVTVLQPGGLRPVPTVVVRVSAEQAGGRAA